MWYILVYMINERKRLCIHSSPMGNLKPSKTKYNWKFINEYDILMQLYN